MPKKYPCPCCGYKTFNEEPSGTYNICPVCYWEDDPATLTDPDYEGGANGVSLRQAQQNFEKYGACEKIMVKSVRKPQIEEMRDGDWNKLS